MKISSHFVEFEFYWVLNSKIISFWSLGLMLSWSSFSLSISSFILLEFPKKNQIIELDFHQAEFECWNVSSSLFKRLFNFLKKLYFSFLKCMECPEFWDLILYLPKKRVQRTIVVGGDNISHALDIWGFWLCKEFSHIFYFSLCQINLRGYGFWPHFSKINRL